MILMGTFNIWFIRVIFFLSIIKFTIFGRFIHLFEVLDLLADRIHFLAFEFDKILKRKYFLFDSFVGLLLFEMFEERLII